MATELVLLGTAGAPAPVAGRAGISSALAVDGRVFVVDCGRGTPSGYADAGLDFARLTGIFITNVPAIDDFEQGFHGRRRQAATVVKTGKVRQHGGSVVGIGIGETARMPFGHSN